MTTTTPMFSDTVVLALIGALGTFLTALVGLLTAVLSRQSTVQKSIVAQHDSIKALEVNTNSLTTQLAKVTGEKEFAKGLKLGTDSAGGSAAGVAALNADIQTKAAHSEGVIEGAAEEKNRAKAEAAAQEPKK